MPYKSPQSLSEIGITQWIGWIVSTFIAAITLTAFCYSNFQTKEDFADYQERMDHRLERIENKVDQLLQASDQAAKGASECKIESFPSFSAI